MAGSSCRRFQLSIRNAHRSQGGPRRRSAAPADLSPPPHGCYHGVRQHEWATWVAKITDRHTGRRIWLSMFYSAAQAAWRHDIENVHLHGNDYDELSFPLGSEEPVPELFASPHRSRVA